MNFAAFGVLRLPFYLIFMHAFQLLETKFTIVHLITTTLLKNILKNDPTTLFTYLKIILL